jgi:SAM-dependent methyltransferase
MTRTVFERMAPPAAVVDASLSATRDGCFWLDDVGDAARHPALAGAHSTDLLVVGGGYTGLWTAVKAKLRNPGTRVVLLEAQTVGWAASGRNGGFCDASLTHGEDNGRARWPDEYDALERLGLENLDAFEADVRDLGIDCEFERTGMLAVAVEEHQVAWLPADHLDRDAVRAEIDSPVFLAGAFETIASCYADHNMFVDAFRTGAGVAWHDHDERLFSGVVRLFRPGYAANLVDEWLPALDGVVEKLQAGASVADVGCGLGASTILLAQAFERSTFAGFDTHQQSIDGARGAASQAGVNHRVRFDVASAKEFPGEGYDLVCVFDALHDMGDPVGAVRRIRQALAPDGTLLLVEPSAGDALEDNLNPVGRTFYGLSTVICTPGSLAQDVGLGLGAQAGERQLA